MGARALIALFALAAQTLAAAGQERAGQEPAISALDLARLRDLDSLSVSPDGRWAVFQVREPDPERNRYAIAWHAVATTECCSTRRIVPGGDIIQPTSSGRINGSIRTPEPIWSTDSAAIIYLLRNEGRTQVWRTHLDSGESDQLTSGPADPVRLALSSDGARLFVETAPSQQQINEALSLEGQRGFLFDRRFFPAYERRPVLPIDVDLNFESARGHGGLQVYDFSIASVRPARPDEADEFQSLVSTPPSLAGTNTSNFARSPAGSMAWTAARDPHQQGGWPPLTLMAQPASAVTPIACAAPQCLGQRFLAVWWRGEEEVLFARGEGPRFRETALYAWRPGEAEARLILKTTDSFVTLQQSEWRCAPTRNQLICFYERPNAPRRLVSIDLRRGDVSTLFDPNPHFSSFNLPTPHFIDFGASEGAHSYGYLVLPRNVRPRRLPLVIVTYRCSGFLRGGTGDEYPIYALAQQGFAVLCFDLPSEDYDRLAVEGYQSYEAWGRGPGVPARQRVQRALDEAVRRLVEEAIVDRDRVALTGLSYGAETVSFALFSMRTPLAAAIASSAGFEPISYYLYGAAGRAVLHEWSLESPYVMPDRWREFALSLNADRVETPLLLNVSDREMLAALQPVAALHEAGRPAEMYVFPDEYHIKWQPAHRLAIYNRNIDWMNFWLRGVESGLTGDATQYERWRTMRENQCRLFGPGGSEYRADAVPWYCRPGALDASVQ